MSNLSFYQKLEAAQAALRKPPVGMFLPAKCNEPTGPDKERVAMDEQIIAADRMHLISTAVGAHLKCGRFGGVELESKAARREERRVAGFLGTPALQLLEAAAHAVKTGPRADARWVTPERGLSRTRR